MSMHEVDPIYVRASVARRCNLDCIYCPKPEGMENRVPKALSGLLLDRSAYVSCLAHIARQGISGVSFTGGEPTLNLDLPWIVERARKLFRRVELTTNGLNFVSMLPNLSAHLDLVKVSLDSLNASNFKALTRGQSDSLDRALAAIEAGTADGLRVGINLVAMKSTIRNLSEIVNYARNTNMRCGKDSIHVSVLDFYYSPSRRSLWENEFLPTEQIESELNRRYGAPKIHRRFGCRFLWYEAEGVNIRLKDSYGATQRAKKCTSCLHYCQEGLYGLKLSAEGWVTTCPTGDPKYGARLTADLTEKQADNLLAPFVEDLALSNPDADSFGQMLRTHALRPVLVDH